MRIVLAGVGTGITIVDPEDVRGLPLPLPLALQISAPGRPIDDPLVGLVDVPDPEVIPETADDELATTRGGTVVAVADLIPGRLVGVADPDPGVGSRRETAVAVVITITEAEAPIIQKRERKLEMSRIVGMSRRSAPLQQLMMLAQMIPI